MTETTSAIPKLVLVLGVLMVGTMFLVGENSESVLLIDRTQEPARLLSESELIPSPLLEPPDPGMFETESLYVGFMDITQRPEFTIWTWGSNTSGQLGLADKQSRQLPTPVLDPNLRYAKAVATGTGVGSAAFTLVLLADGRVKAFGDNTFGQLGDGTTIERATPTFVLDDRGAHLTQIKAIAAGAGFSAFLHADGMVWYCGLDIFDGATAQNPQGLIHKSPARVLTNIGIKKIACGSRHLLALSADGKVLAGGINQTGELGSGVKRPASQPELLSDAFNEGVIDIAAGPDFSMALRGDGTVWTWGYGDKGQLGRGQNMPTALPGVVPVADLVVKIAAGEEAKAAVITEKGEVYVWGLSLGEQSFVPVPLGNIAAAKAVAVGGRITLLQGDGTLVEYAPVYKGQVQNLRNVLEIATSPFHSVALVSNRRVWRCGSFDNGASYIFNTDSVPRDQGVEHVLDVAAGRGHTLALTADGHVWAWGENKRGQLGADPQVLPETDTPTEIAKLHDIVAVAAGEEHSMALDATGRVFVWGSNWRGQLTAAIPDRYLSMWQPVLVTPWANQAHRVKAIAAASNSCLAITADGQVWGWGLNVYARQLGFSSETTEVWFPARNPNIRQGIEIAPGHGTFFLYEYEQTVFLEADGTITAGAKRQLFGPLGSIALAQGVYTTLALNRYGMVMAWGWNFDGQFGDGKSGSYIIRYGEFAYAHVWNVIGIAAGSNHTVFLSVDGTVLTCGSDRARQLGHPITVFPAKVPGLDRVSRVRAGYSQTLALR